MKLKPLVLALASAGVVAGTAGAAGWNPSEWFPHKVAQDKIAPSPTTAPPATAIGPVSAPNYRAIVERFGPAVVGINTQGMANTSIADGAPDDPFFKFFRGLPGQMPRGDVPVRGKG